jgi:TolB-like protein
VLPFKNLSGDPEQEYFADGMVEDIIDGLENAPRALIGLIAGENRGKRMVRVG